MGTAQSESNKQKSISGKKVRDELEELFENLLTNGLINSFERDVSYTHKDYSYKKQFLTDFLVETLDNKYILIRTSNSFRTDRIKINFYDFIGVQQYSKFSGDIVASILLFPDNERENKTFLSNRAKFHNKEFYSPATHWLTFSEFIDFIENYKSETLDEKEEIDKQNQVPSLTVEGDYKKFSDVLNPGRVADGGYYGKTGNKLEKYLVHELNDSTNLKLFKKNKSKCVEYKVLISAICEHFTIDISKIKKIIATDTIIRLNNGGSPKTDVNIKLFDITDAVLAINLTIKNSISSKVSCHDYKAEDYLRVLDSNNKELKVFLELFQEAGSWSAFDNLCKKKNIVPKKLENVLGEYMDKLIVWAVTGEGDLENINDKDLQIANFIFTRNAATEDCYAYSAEYYIQKLISIKNKGRGSPFGWTYPSKNRGKRIQLKMPLII